MNQIEVVGTIGILLSLISLLGWEIRGLIRRYDDPTHWHHDETVTKLYAFADAWLNSHAAWADWIFRIFTLGFFIWLPLHLIGVIK